MADTKVLLVGSGGQLGQALISHTPMGVQLTTMTHAQLDIGDRVAVEAAVQSAKPQVIINAAAYTAVDKAETDQAAAEHGNVAGPENLSYAAKAIGARLIHVSTDFVFDGNSSKPYRPDDVTAPLGVYGRTKREGELAAQGVLADRALIVRTAWVYGATGKNFFNTMLKLMTERGAVRVVADQIGSPTCTHSLADMVWHFVSRPDLSGIYHWTDAGVASWYDFAVAIAEEAVASGVLPTLPTVTPIATNEFPTPAKRPSCSVLDKSATYAALGLIPVHWRVRLREVFKHLAHETKNKENA